MRIYRYKVLFLTTGESTGAVVVVDPALDTFKSVSVTDSVKGGKLDGNVVNGMCEVDKPPHTFGSLAVGASIIGKFCVPFEKTGIPPFQLEISLTH